MPIKISALNSDFLEKYHVMLKKTRAILLIFKELLAVAYLMKMKTETSSFQTKGVRTPQFLQLFAVF